MAICPGGLRDAPRAGGAARGDGQRDPATRRPCPVCGARSTEVLHRLALRTPDGHPLQGGYPVVSCLACGTGFADVDVDVRYYDRYYARLARYATEAGAGGDGPAEDPSATARCDESADVVAALVGRTTARILDIGCANGTLLAALRRRGFEDLGGVDPSPAAARAAATQGVRVDVGTVTALPGDLGRFDCVCLTGVLEHLWDPSSAIGTAASLLRPGGILYVEVPDAARYLDPYIAPFTISGSSTSIISATPHSRLWPPGRGWSRCGRDATTPSSFPAHPAPGWWPPSRRGDRGKMGRRAATCAWSAPSVPSWPARSTTSPPSRPGWSTGWPARRNSRCGGWASSP
jgi:SAM-dependent methyltransferase